MAPDMSRRSDLFQLLFGLRHNPFRHGAIATPGADTAFYVDLYPSIAQQMATAFLSAGKPPPIGVLWSLGTGEDARGFGKTRYLLWFADEVNRDQGRRALALAGAHGSSEVVLALYAAFHTLSGVSLSHLLFDVVRSVVDGPRSPLAAVLAGGSRDRWSLHAAGTKFLTATRQPWSPALLNKLCYTAPDKVALFLADPCAFRNWHKARWGRELFRTVVAFLRMLGVSRLVVLVDQVEDFASWMTPAYKLRRDFGRLAELCIADPALCGHVTFVLTMHPESARVATRHWPGGALGSISPSRPGRHMLVLREPPLAGILGMVKAYLERERVVRGGDRLRPFTPGAVSAVHALCGGRPGRCIPLLGALLETAADLRVARIDEAEVSAWLGADDHNGGRDD
jgi:hypothetical protein